MINQVQADADALYIGNLNTVDADLSLPSRGANGSRITWSSADPRFLTDEGKVTRPRYGLGDRDIPLTAVIEDGIQRLEKVFPVHILEAPNDIQVREVLPVRLYVQRGKTLYLPTAVALITEEGDTIAHAADWDVSEVRFEQEGTFEISGRIAGTLVPVQAAITVTAEDPTIRKHRDLVQHPMPEGDVRLSAGTPFYERQQQFLRFLLETDPDPLLYNFRKAAGLSVQGALPMTGWDSPDCRLRGHTTGHFLSALAYAYSATGEERIRDKACYMVHALGLCQKAFSEQEGFHPGFLSGYSEEQFDLLEQYVRYPKIWAPYYTLHKILAGLLDIQEILHIEEAGEIARRLGLWVYHRLARLDHDRRCRMWSLYIAGEYGGMNEALGRLYRMTGDARYLEAARMFDNDKLFFPLESGVDALSGMHANQHIPQAIGALTLYEATDEERYYAIAGRFWEKVTKGHVYAIGGTGEGEMFQRTGRIAGLLTDRTAESCASYNLLKLTRRLHRLDPDPAYIRYYERTLLNHILPASEASEKGRTTYFMPLRSGARMLFEDENSCCHGTGLESPFQFNRMIWTRNDTTLYLHLFIDSSLTCEGVRLTTEILEDGVRAVVRFDKALDRNLMVRIPDWSGETERYLEEKGPFRAGDERTFFFPCRLRWEASPDVPGLGVYTWGPYVLAAETQAEEAISLRQTLEKIPGTLTFRSAGTVLAPLYRMQDRPYQVYLPPIVEKLQ